MANIKFVQPTHERLLRIAENINPLDRLELEASLRLNPLSALIHCVDSSHDSFVVEVDGVPQVAFGIADAWPWGAPWVLGTREIVHWADKFMGMSREILKDWLSGYGHLVVATDARHYQSHRWLNELGFKITGVIDDYGWNDEPFYVYEICVTP